MQVALTFHNQPFELTLMQYASKCVDGMPEVVVVFLENTAAAGGKGAEVKDECFLCWCSQPLEFQLCEACERPGPLT